MKRLIMRFRVWLLWRRLIKKYGAKRIHEWIQAIAEVSKVAAALYSLGIKMNEDPE